MTSILLHMLTFLNPQSCLVFLLVFLLTYNYLTRQPWKKLPPGPWTFPVLGSTLSLGSDIRPALDRLGQRYGDVFTLYLGGTRVVVLRGFHNIKEAFAKKGHSFSDRPDIFFIKYVTERWGIVSSSGHFWKDQRQQSLHILRDLGVGRSVIEDIILKEVRRFTQELHKNVNQPFSPTRLLQQSICCLISSIGYGQHWQYDDPGFMSYMERMEHSFEVLGHAGLFNLFPFLRLLPGDIFGLKKVLCLKEETHDWYRQAFQKRVAEYDEERKPMDFMDGYVQLMKKEENKAQTTFSEKQAVSIMGDLIGAGTETTSGTLQWAIIYMVHNPDIQDRVRAEIDTVIRSGEFPTMADRSRLPYTEATLLEIQRISTIVPLGVPHSAAEDVEFQGYFIPKGTMIMADMWSVHFDPKLWSNPEQFDPTRFLDDSGSIVHREELIPFSIGKRVCLGEALARMELFLYFVSILKYFKVKETNLGMPTTKGKLGATYSPLLFSVIFEPV